MDKLRKLKEAHAELLCQLKSPMERFRDPHNARSELNWFQRRRAQRLQSQIEIFGRRVLEIPDLEREFCEQANSALNSDELIECLVDLDLAIHDQSTFPPNMEGQNQADDHDFDCDGWIKSFGSELEVTRASSTPMLLPWQKAFNELKVRIVDEVRLADALARYDAGDASLDELKSYNTPRRIAREALVEFYRAYQRHFDLPNLISNLRLVIDQGEGSLEASLIQRLRDLKRRFARAHQPNREYIRGCQHISSLIFDTDLEKTSARDAFRQLQGKRLSESLDFSFTRRFSAIFRDIQFAANKMMSLVESLPAHSTELREFIKARKRNQPERLVLALIEHDCELSFEDAAVHVWQDHSKVISESSAFKLRGRTNKIIKEKGFKVVVSSGRFFLKKLKST